MVLPPPIVWIGAHPDNYRVGRNLVAPEGICVHTMVGTLRGCDSWFNTPPSQRFDVNRNPIGPSSATFGVGRDGLVHQYVDLNDAAIANGNESGATAWLVRENPGVSANDYTFSIEHDDNARPGVDLPTDAQFDASTRLAAWLWFTRILPGGATNLSLDRNHIVRHAEFAPSTRAGCPGWPEPLMVKYVDRVKALLSPSPAGANHEREYIDALTITRNGLNADVAEAQRLVTGGQQHVANLQARIVGIEAVLALAAAR